MEEGNKKLLKKVLTEQKTHDIISELRYAMSRSRTLTNKQQCNPENSKKNCSENKT